MSDKEEQRAEFKKAYASLNSAQKNAVDAIEGPVMVIAGPGTGKTQILTLRIANILLKTDVRPENILALTFTESGATAMRERLRKYIGAEAYRVNISTFHGFAQRLIQDYPDAYNKVIGGRPASDLEKVSLIETILESNEIRHLRPTGDPSYYVIHILKMLSSMKQEYITPDALKDIIKKQEIELLEIERIHQKGAHKGKIRSEYTKKEKSIQKNHELLYVYQRYEAILNQERLYDFEDMIVETVEALSKNEDMLIDLQESYQYILADEHQDVNGSQNKILELLSSYHQRPNIFVVGDEKQAIYRFQGASLENFLYFENVFKETKTIALTDNYRSGQLILDAAHSLISLPDGPAAKLRIPLTSISVNESTVERRDFNHQAVEDLWVIETVESNIKDGVAHGDIAVIVRTNREVEQYAALLRSRNIPVTASADGDILKHPITNSIRSLIDAVVKSTDESALFRVLHGTYWGIVPSDFVRIASARRYDLPLVEILTSKKKLRDIKVADIDAAVRVMDVLGEARKREVKDSPHRVLEYLLKESGFLKHIIASDPLEGGRVVRRVYDEIERMVLHDDATTLWEVSTSFLKHHSYGLPLNAPYITTQSHAVKVMTAHKSKGLEFETVIIPHVTDSLWGGKKRRRYFDIPITKHMQSYEFDEVDDERRLLYVAMTRAKKRLYLSSSEMNTEGRELTLSRLFEDMDDSYLSQMSTDKEEKEFDPLTTLQGITGSSLIDVSLLDEALRERGLSATSLNNYLKSPWNYMYRNVLRIPEVQPSYMLFGTAMHNVMERVTAYHTKEQKMPSDSEVKKFLDRELSRLPITKEEYVRLHEKGYAALLSYLSHIAPSLPKITKEEFSLRVMLPTGILGFSEVPLTGKLDRLDFDKEGNLVRVVDYKTGKSKSRNAIEGKTQSSDGAYKRQLVFYGLLLSLYGDERYACREGVLSFLEPDGKGIIHEELFTITDKEIEELKAEIIRVTNEIITGEFLKKPCDPNESEYCDLAKMLQLNIGK